MNNNLMRFQLAIVVLLLPVIGYCNPFSDLFKNPKDVAVKVAELPEQYNINVDGLDFSLDGKQLAVVSANQTINIWDWQNKRIVQTLQVVSGAVLGEGTEPIRYSPDGRFFAACGRGIDDIVVRVWGTQTWAVAHDITDPIKGGGCEAIGFSPDGKSLMRIKSLAYGVPGDNLFSYSTETWQQVWALRTIPLQPYALAISPDGKLVTLGGAVMDKGLERQQIAIVDVAQRTIIRTAESNVEFLNGGRLAWSPDGEHITAIGRRAWDGFANHGNGAFTGGLDTVMVFDAHTGKQIASEQLKIGYASLRYTPDGKYLIEGDNDGRNGGLGVRIWDGQHRELLQEIPGAVTSLAVSQDGHYFAMGTYKKTLVWQLK
jgi:WD40 repeat protein